MTASGMTEMLKVGGLTLLDCEHKALTKTHNNNIIVIMIPPFQTNGNLPPGIHDATWTQITTHFGHTPHRLRLLAGLLDAAQALHQAGSQWILVNGSFVTSKIQPNDIDACYDDTNLDYILLEQLEPSLVDFSNRRAAQKPDFTANSSPPEPLPTVQDDNFEISLGMTATTKTKAL